ncbi:unnamed protein product [Rotaria socialis]|uniref:Uncharacterized protein n=1 Tax=Rotaria socialis TaxID=392032 RepID=A0A818TNT3_9BILA|nr:unnamed protein product [Rotaria socialis]CAF4506151.1 unnamed protein product [Rotaria socialis]
MTEILSRSTTKTVQISDVPLTHYLAVEGSNIEPDSQQFGLVVPSKRKISDTISTYIIWSIFYLLFIPFGVVCCYLPYKVSNFKTLNSYEIAEQWSKRTFVLNIMITILMFGITITVAMLHYDYEQRMANFHVNQTHATGAYIPWQPGR